MDELMAEMMQTETIRLGDATLDDLPPEVKRPSYDRARLTPGGVFALTASVLIGVANYLISKLSVKIGY